MAKMIRKKIVSKLGDARSKSVKEIRVRTRAAKIGIPKRVLKRANARRKAEKDLLRGYTTGGNFGRGVK